MNQEPNLTPDMDPDFDAKVHKPQTDGFAIAGLILGILSVVCCCLSAVLPFTSLIFAILAIVFAVVSRKKIGKFSAVALTALILGIVGAVTGLIGTIAFIIAESNIDLVREIFGDEFADELQNMLNNLPQEN